jgi:Right handed beta helix region
LCRPPKSGRAQRSINRSLGGDSVGLRQPLIRSALVSLSILLLAAASSAASGVGGTVGPHRASRPGTTLYVAKHFVPGTRGQGCSSAPYSTVQSAVNAAPARATVVVCKGTYTEDVVIDHPLVLKGKRGAKIHGSAHANGKCDQLGPTGPGSAPCLAAITIKSSNVTVEGLAVTGAIGEGILATGSLSHHSIQHVVIEGNRVTGNNIGGIPPTSSSPYPECVEFQQIPGDCGEGIHLMGVAFSRVTRNYVSGNQGGVLITDEFGPTHANRVDHNTVTKNAYDCGVTAPGHNPNALDSSGRLQPKVAGVYDNIISHNTITDNGLKGEGAGVLFANASSGSAAYDNLVEYNTISGNELSGVTLHAHTLKPGQAEALGGNQIVHNTIGKNNTGGDGLDGTAKDASTTGILVFSGTVPVKVKIAQNTISDDAYGIWLGVAGHVTASLAANTFLSVTTRVFTSP